ncbi:hypothetical protein [Helicobacter sp. T3_23-1056]
MLDSSESCNDVLLESSVLEVAREVAPPPPRFHTKSCNAKTQNRFC